MKKKLLSILGCMVLMMVLLSLSVSAAYTLPEVHKKDTVYRGKLTDVNTGTLIPFNYEVPEDGVAVIYFYKTTCGNCQYTFSSLNETAWIRNDRIKFYAIESTPENGVEEIRGFQKEYTPNITDVFTWLDSPSPFLCGDYLENAGLYSGGWTWPVVVVITEENGVNTIRAATDGATDVRLLGNTLELLLKEDLGIPKPVPITISVTVDYDKAAELAELTNQKRKENGLPPLQLDKTLTEAAMTRAAEAALFPSEARPDGTASYELIDLYMLNNTMGNCFVGFSCDTAEKFWEDYIDPENFYRWYLAEYEESGGTLVGAGCVYYNNTYYWAVAISDGSAQAGAPDQAGQSTRRYTINTYLTCLNSPGPVPAEVTLYPETSAEVQLLANTRWLDTPLIPTAYNKEVKNSSGQTIATAKMQADGSILVTAQAVGTGKLQISAWDGQETPYTATITVSDVPEYRPHQIHTTTTGGGRIVLFTETAVKDERIKISLSPDEGYWMAGLYVTDAEGNTPQVYYSSDLEYILCMPASDVYITAQFLSNDIPQTPYTVFTSSNGNGELEFFNDRRTHYATTTVTVSPVPNDGYILAGLTATDDYGNSIDITPNADGSYSFQMPASDVMLRPFFAPKEGYAIIVADSYGCTVTPNSATALPGETVTVTITPDEGYELRDYSTNLWEDDSTLTGPNTLTFTMPDHDVELYVYCKPSPITVGTLGDNTRWSYKDGTLTISGEGSMGENENFSALPWYDYLSDIHTVVIEEGVTDIFYRAFSNIDGLTSITIPSTVDYIGEWAFLSDENLTKITFAGSAPSRGMESSVFSGVTAIVYVPANDRSWTDEITRDYSGILTWTHSWSSEVIDPTCTEDGYT
ncbi:MAG: leucine-rich repeat protein, partial [Oscillospiraceae bacterium]|nr:leucine-rich repeat protein [Oscillospiraceae bacterium]